MGQYWIPVNLDKKEFIDPHTLGTGLKLWEQVASHPGTSAALIILCAAQPELRGGGDIAETDVGEERIVGRWAGNRIALVGDYAEDSDLPAEFEASKIYGKCTEARDGADNEYRDISLEVCTVLERELWIKYVGEGLRNIIGEEDTESPW